MESSGKNDGVDQDGLERSDAALVDPDNLIPDDILIADVATLGSVASKITFPKTWRSEFQGLLVLAVLIAGGVALSINFPGTIVKGPLVTVAEHRIFLSLPLIWLVPAIWLGVLIFRIYNVRFTADERGLQAVEGILSFSQTITRVRYEDVRSLEMDQTLLERFLNVGDLEVGTAGTSDVELVFAGVGSPFVIKGMIQARRDARESRDGQEEIMFPSSRVSP